MSERYIRNTVVSAKLEQTYGDGVGDNNWTGADALLIRNASFRRTRDVVPRELIYGHLGGSEHLAAARRAEISFDVEMAPSGTPGVAPPWGRLLQACGMAETVTDDDRVTYTPVSTAFPSLVIRYAIDGVRHFCRGARGNVTFRLNAYDIPVLAFTFTGFDHAASVAALPNANFADWQRPEVIMDANSSDIRLGAALDASERIQQGVGTTLASRGIEINLGNTVTHQKLLGGERVIISARDTSGRTTVELSPEDEVQWRNDINQNVTTSLAFATGSLDGGRRMIVYMPKVQRIDPQVTDQDGTVMFSSELRVLPDQGNDEFRLVLR